MPKYPEIYSKQKITALYEKIPLQKEEVKLLRQYCEAMVNLYGIIPLKKAWQIVLKQNPDTFTRKQLNDFALVARYEDTFFAILGDEEVFDDNVISTPTQRTLYDVSLMNEDVEIIQQVRASQHGKDYYIPEKKDLLRYRNWHYCEPTPESKAMKEFLAEIGLGTSTLRNFTFRDLTAISKMPSFSMEPVAKFVGELKLTEEQVRKFFQLYQSFCNNLRIQANLGHTPEEISKLYPHRIPDEIEFGSNVRKAVAKGDINPFELMQHIESMNLPNENLKKSMMNQVKVMMGEDFILSEDSASYVLPEGQRKITSIEKVGRNQPCPCGSGLKYKRCCGR
ncbi:MAG: SEC-C domain-containing protein [Eubacteriales bacterium]